MTALPADPQIDEPLIPMPALTPGALRAAVESLTPSRMPTFISDLVDATTSAQELQSLAPLRTFVHTWGVFVAIQRYPSLAARLRHLEEMVSAGVEDPTDAIVEIRKIHVDAEAEAGL
ncbi:hypothetical protein PV396_17465 [Streptomyces sp. ME02-8801-2C]|uniref:DUF6247 family protein n=1 Tax=Streptomyces sp. ME02-8801-2C TaxID=3028680 RepID=UPI0029AC406F|nr:DUF6247 family protein [Streptomyces sp. ME02-8801-2C]MDX3453720.1 hypothetical protein [Streptomyces sp. ME02-8801-2C]